jgi:hypothetical protein
MKIAPTCAAQIDRAAVWMFSFTPKILSVLSVCAGIALAPPAQANSFCDGLDQLGATLTTTSAPDQSFALQGHETAGYACLASLNTKGQRSLHCMWTFPYRAGAATAAFDMLLAEVTICSTADAQHDQGVNHPDFYDLRQFAFADRTVGVSIKDKGALQQTLVFLTVSGP